MASTSQLNLPNASQGVRLKGIDLFSETEAADSCYLEFYELPHPGNETHVYCNSTWDGLSCWPTTLSGEVSSIPCFEKLNGVIYDTSKVATRKCMESGVWASWSNYRNCKPLRIHPDELIQVLWDMREATTVYYIGYSLSLVALTLALCVFFFFRDLRCLRNAIHTNLLLTYFLIDLTWILTASLQSSYTYSFSKVACFLVILLTYLMGTNFFWMFVEGLYLYLLVVETFTVDKVRLWVYALIGWGIPALIATAWASAKGFLGYSEDPLAPQGCPWQRRDDFDYIFICPVLAVLLINTAFLGKIMWVLITKLRAANTAESRQYRKAAKALLVLIPLLGLTYILVIATPSDRTAEVIFTYIQATLLSIQGFIVAILYCFLNGEVQNSLRHRFERWKMQRSLKNLDSCSLVSSNGHGRDWIKLYNAPNNSVSTTSTFLTSNINSSICGRYRSSTGGTSPLLPMKDDTV